MVVVVALISIGVGALLAPRRSSAQYGIVLDDARAIAFVRAMGVRDVVIGGLLGLLAWEHADRMLGLGMCLTASIAVIDLVVVAADRRLAPSLATSWRRDRAPILHGAGAVGLLLAGVVLLAGY